MGRGVVPEQEFCFFFVFFGKVGAGLVGVISELELQGKLHKRYLLLRRHWVGRGRMGDN